MATDTRTERESAIVHVLHRTRPDLPVSDDTLEQLTALSFELDGRYPDAVMAAEHEAVWLAALIAAAEYLTGVAGPEDIRAELDALRAATDQARARALQVALLLVAAGESERDACRRTGTHRNVLRQALQTRKDNDA